MKSTEHQPKTASGDFWKRFLGTLTFVNLPIRGKFLFFSAGTLFWLIATSAVGFIMISSLGRETVRLVNVINPEQKVLNSVSRKLRGADIDIHKMILEADSKEIDKAFFSAKAKLEDCRLFLMTLNNGGYIKDYSRTSDEIYDEYSVAPISPASKKDRIEEIVGDIKQMDELAVEIIRLRTGNAGVTPALKIKISEFDAATEKNVTAVTKLSVSLSREWGNVSDIIREKFRLALLLISLTFIAGASLAVIFSFLISRNIVMPLKAIAAKFKAFSSRDMDFTKELEVVSKDEIGALASEYNHLLETIKVVTSFKKLIEEDETVDDVYLRLGNVITGELGFRECSIYEISTMTNAVKAVFPAGADLSNMRCGVEMMLSSDLCRAKRTAQTVSSLDYRGICKNYDYNENGLHYCIPFMIEGKVGGVVQIIVDKKTSQSADLYRRLSHAAEYIAEAQPVLSSKRIMRAFKESSIKDSLTGMYNRRFLQEIADSMTEGIVRRGTILGVLMCDLDFFKAVNDTYGHDIGDRVLSDTAACMKKCIRGADLIVRFGGEEFVIFLIDMNPEHSMEISDKIRDSVENNKIHTAAGILQVTISIGISEFPADTLNLWEAIKFADLALYRAKETGRNRVVRFSAEMRKDGGF
jgi:two-component system cell cycle response regulator